MDTYLTKRLSLINSKMEQTLSERIKHIIAYLPISQGRVPYTYHHDYIKTNLDKFAGMSRSEVAQATQDHSEDELYAFALLGALSSINGVDLVYSFASANRAKELFEAVVESTRLFDEFQKRLYEDEKVDELQIRQPQDLEDALNMLADSFGIESIALMHNMSQDEFGAAIHMGTGMSVRNNWNLWWFEGHTYEEWPKEKPALVDYFTKLGINHADDISGILMTSFYRRVTGKPIDVEGQLPTYFNHWKELGYKDGIYTPNKEPAN